MLPIKIQVAMESPMTAEKKKVNRIQTGIRIEKRILKVLKAIAAHHEIGLGDLIEGIVLHSFEGKSAFNSESLAFIEQMRVAYELDLTATDSHKLTD
jgi:predicted DNA-binding ribbon-helix-helix protein